MQRRQGGNMYEENFMSENRYDSNIAKNQPSKEAEMNLQINQFNDCE